MSLHHLDESVQTLSSRYKYAHLKTDWAPQIMHRNIAIILWQLYYSKITFVVLMFPGNFEIFNLLCCKFPSKTCATVSCKKVRTKFSLADKFFLSLSLSLSLNICLFPFFLNILWSVVVAHLVERSLPTPTPRFESSQWQKIILNIYCQLYWKDKNKEIRGQDWPIFKTFFDYSLSLSLSSFIFLPLYLLLSLSHFDSFSLSLFHS